MVDTTDLKSVDLIGREGSSPSTPSFLIYQKLIEYSDSVYRRLRNF